MPQIQLMPKILVMYSWGKCADIQATFEVDLIKDVARIIVHRG